MREKRLTFGRVLKLEGMRLQEEGKKPPAELVVITSLGIAGFFVVGLSNRAH